jgi:hypothetical protein
MGRGRGVFLALLIFVWLLGVTRPGYGQASYVVAEGRAAESATATSTPRFAAYLPIIFKNYIPGQEPPTVTPSATVTFTPTRMATSTATATPTTTATPTPSGPGFHDDMEGGPGLWLADPPWALITSDAHSPTHSWTDSPNGDYANNANVSLTSVLFRLTSFSSPVLRFWTHYQLEEGYDYGRVELSTSAGISWTTVATYTGEVLDWVEEQVDLSGYAGQPAVQLRFRLTSDYQYTFDGWYIDDVDVREASTQGSIFGTITYRDQASPGILVELVLYDYGGATGNVAARAVTDATGGYRFTGLPTLTADQVYVVRYRNLANDPRYLRSWESLPIIAYTAGDDVWGGDFDLADVALGSPDDTTPRSLPVTFHWSKRADSPDDSYEVELWDPAVANGTHFASGELGYVDEYVLDAWPPDFQPGVTYAWDVLVHGPTGQGRSRETHSVVFE